MILKGKYNESRIDHTYRDPERDTEKRRILLPDLQGAADCAAVSEEMDGHSGTESSTGAIRGEVRTEESAELKSREQDEENAG
jgi:hypothetical protein